MHLLRCCSESNVTSNANLRKNAYVSSFACKIFFIIVLAVEIEATVVAGLMGSVSVLLVAFRSLQSYTIRTNLNDGMQFQSCKYR